MNEKFIEQYIKDVQRLESMMRHNYSGQKEQLLKWLTSDNIDRALIQDQQRADRDLIKSLQGKDKQIVKRRMRKTTVVLRKLEKRG